MQKNAFLIKKSRYSNSSFSKTTLLISINVIFDTPISGKVLAIEYHSFLDQHQNSDGH